MLVPLRRLILQGSCRRPYNAVRLLTIKFPTDDPNRMFREQMEELKLEREELFGFTDDERQSWTKVSTHSSDLLKEIQQARELEMVQPHEEPGYEGPAPTVRTPDKPILSHVSADATEIHMVDVGDKKVTKRIAVAQSQVLLPPEVLLAFQSSADETELTSPKGPIFATAKLAGIMAAKRTSELIPLCHPLPLDHVHLDIELRDRLVTIRCTCRVTHKTGVEMEALTGASVAALTIYDMVKAASHNVKILDTQLIQKEGGKREVGGGGIR